MRNLTQKEIDQAPDWAINYVMSDDNRNIRWQDEVTFKWDDCEFRQAFSGKPLNDFRPIPRKEFDLKEWYHALTSVNDHSSLDQPYLYDLSDDGLGVDGYVCRDYAIAFAKHFKLTAEDLK